MARPDYLAATSPSRSPPELTPRQDLCNQYHGLIVNKKFPPALVTLPELVTCAFEVTVGVVHTDRLYAPSGASPHPPVLTWACLLKRVWLVDIEMELAVLFRTIVAD
jgi:hypothetical protein